MHCANAGKLLCGPICMHDSCGSAAANVLGWCALLRSFPRFLLLFLNAQFFFLLFFLQESLIFTIEAARDRGDGAGYLESCNVRDGRRVLSSERSRLDKVDAFLGLFVLKSREGTRSFVASF